MFGDTNEKHIFIIKSNKITFSLLLDDIQVTQYEIHENINMNILSIKRIESVVNHFRSCIKWTDRMVQFDINNVSINKIMEDYGQHRIDKFKDIF